MGKMRVSFTNSFMVKPAGPTWKGRIPLSPLDHVGVATLSHVQTIFVYNKPPQNWLTPTDRIIKTLRDSLSQALQHFYPLAGRLRSVGGGRLELDCNDTGALLVEAESDAKLEDFGELSPLSPELQYLIPCVDNNEDELPAVHEIPLVIVQLTKLGCGGVTLGLAMSHSVCDGQGASHFISEWTRLARAEPLGAVPFFERKVLWPQGEEEEEEYSMSADQVEVQHFQHKELCPPPLLLGETSSEGRERINKKTKGAMLRLTREQVEELKRTANKEGLGRRGGGRPYSRYEVITGHIWKCACKARRHKMPHLQQTTLRVCVDIRNRLKPPLPKSYFGNGVYEVVASSSSGELVSRPLAYASRRIRETIQSVTDEYVRSAINFLNNQPDISSFLDLPTDDGQPRFYGNPNLGVVSWINLPFQGTDFGWGREIYMGPGSHGCFDGETIILPGGGGGSDGSKGADGSLIVAAWFHEDYMDAFRKFFYEDIPRERETILD